MKLSRRIVLQAAVENEYGVDPGSGYQAILLRAGSEITPAGEYTERDVLRDTLSPQGGVVTAKQYELSLPVELRGGGLNAGVIVPPEVDPLLRASCLRREDAVVLELSGVVGKFAEGDELKGPGNVTVGIVVDHADGKLFVRAVESDPAEGDTVAQGGASATVDAVHDALCYRPVSQSQDWESVTLRYYLDGIRHVGAGIRGSVAFQGSVRQIPTLTFQCQGLFSPPTDESNPAATYSQVVPAPVMGARVQLGDLDMSLMAITELSLDQGNEVSAREDVQAPDAIRGFGVTARNPQVGLNPEVVPLADYNPIEDWSKATRRKVYWDIGHTDGERCRMIMPRVQVSSPSYQDRNGTAAYQLTGTPIGSDAGDDEFYIIFY